VSGPASRTGLYVLRRIRKRYSCVEHHVRAWHRRGLRAGYKRQGTSTSGATPHPSTLVPRHVCHQRRAGEESIHLRPRNSHRRAPDRQSSCRRSSPVVAGATGKPRAAMIVTAQKILELAKQAEISTNRKIQPNSADCSKPCYRTAPSTAEPFVPPTLRRSATRAGRNLRQIVPNLSPSVLSRSARIAACDRRRSCRLCLSAYSYLRATIGSILVARRAGI
jgi:hypothetical protein